MCYAPDYEDTGNDFYNPEGEGKGDGDRVGEAFGEFGDRVQGSGVGQAVGNFFDVSFTGSCPTYSASAGPFDITFDQWCGPNVPWSLIAGIIMATALFVGARICFG